MRMQEQLVVNKISEFVYVTITRKLRWMFWIRSRLLGPHCLPYSVFLLECSCERSREFFVNGERPASSMTLSQVYNTF